MRVSPGEIVVTESQTSVEVCVEADGELEIGKQIVTSLSTRSITAIGTVVPVLYTVSVLGCIGISKGQPKMFILNRCFMLKGVCSYFG